jgi:hypothetical protein
MRISSSSTWIDERIMQTYTRSARTPISTSSTQMDEKIMQEDKNPHQGGIRHRTASTTTNDLTERRVLGGYYSNHKTNEFVASNNAMVSVQNAFVNKVRSVQNSRAHQISTVYNHFQSMRKLRSDQNS